eukprot:44153-Prymnesium_polylepis.1
MVEHCVYRKRARASAGIGTPQQRLELGPVQEPGRAFGTTLDACGHAGEGPSPMNRRGVVGDHPK